MPSNFTNGWFGNDEKAWHGQGVVTEGTLPAREAFETANALFPVEKRPLSYPRWETSDDVPQPYQVHENSGVFGLVRTDTQQLLGVVSKQYEEVQNQALLRMAEFIREEADMDSVVVLANGAKVCFTATLKGASTDIVPGDTVKRRLVGYLGHDGKTGCGAKFTNIRVVCQNTLSAALAGSGNHRSITHKRGANLSFDKLITSINIARQSFEEECEYMREFASRSMNRDGFREFVNTVYNVTDEDIFRKRQSLERAFNWGMGAEFAPNSIWNAVNAVTEIETSTRNKTAANARKQFARANFGVGLEYSRKATELAKQLVNA